ncbi:hypothetical protein ACP70R_010204 [Stipagrostis hirtigluma subsp. patula]
MKQALFPLVFLLLASTTSKASVLEDACKTFAAGRPDVGYDYCVKFFQADPGSATAELLTDLAAIGAKLAGAAAKSTVERIDDLKATEKDKGRLECLSTCAKLYSDAVDQAGEAAAGIPTGNTEDAVAALDVVTGVASACELAFQELHQPSPLATEDAEFGKESAIAYNVASSLLPS